MLMPNRWSPSVGRLAQTKSYSSPTPQALWRSIYLFNLYRLTVSLLFVILANTIGEDMSLGSSNPALFLRTSFVYAGLALVSLIAVKLQRPGFNWQLAFQVATDIVCVTLLSHASGGIQSSMGILLLISLAAAGLISRGKITLFFAAMATIAMLLQHSYAVLTQDAVLAQYLQVGVLSVAYFAVAWLAHTLAQHAIVSEGLAAKRGVDFANMAEANRLVIQDMPDGVLVVDGDGMVRQHNPSVERLLAYTFLPDGDVALKVCAPLLEERFTAWRERGGREQQLMQLPLSHHPVRVRFLPVQRDGLWGAVIFLEDMQRVQAQAQQIKLVALGRLTANIAHEVRNPLSAISYAAELLQEQEHDPTQVRLFRIILDNTTRLNNIVLDILQLNRRDRVRPEEVNLAEKLPLFLEGLRHTEGVSLEVFRVEATAHSKINFDRGHLEQVLWNICRNALRYCQMREGSVQIRAWSFADGVGGAEEGTVVLEIANDGPPVAPEAVQQLFEPFFTTESGGTGLGLYIARELCEANGAVLEYIQQIEGACFRIKFGGQHGG